MSNKKQSAGHIPRPIGAPWNRSSAFSADFLGALNGAILHGVRHAIGIFEKELGDVTDEERAAAREEGLPLIAQGITDAVMAFAETLKR